MPLFYQPALDSTGNRVAQDPATGQLYPAVFIGGFVPGSGDPVNGMVRFDDGSYPEGFRDNPSIQLGPRFGFAYDPTGAGKTAIRGAFGVTKQPVSAAGSFLWETTMNPPIQFAPQIFYGSMDTLLSSQGVLFPSSVSSIERENLTPTVYNWNFGIQHELFSNTVLDVAYVGNTARHLLQSQISTRFLTERASIRPIRTLQREELFPITSSGRIRVLGVSITLRTQAPQITTPCRLRLIAGSAAEFSLP